LGVLPYQLFHFGKHEPDLSSEATRKAEAKGLWGSSGKDALVLENFRRLLGRMNANDRKLLFSMAQKMARSR
jgi:hypothetical protein